MCVESPGPCVSLLISLDEGYEYGVFEAPRLASWPEDKENATKGKSRHCPQRLAEHPFWTCTLYRFRDDLAASGKADDWFGRLDGSASSEH